jgi:RTC4-like domain
MIHSYGPKGSAVLRATISRLFDPRNGIPTDTFAPLSYEQYTYFVLIPYMASRLIADDRGFTDNQQCTLQHAFEIMVASADAGDALQGIDEEGKDEQFDDVLMKIMLNQVTELDYVPVAQVSQPTAVAQVLQPTAVAPQQQKGRKKVCLMSSYFSKFSLCTRQTGRGQS